MQGASAMMADEEHKDEEASSSDEDEEAALQECCEPEHNAVQELEKELQEQFNVEEYNRFKARMEEEERQQ